ncbi:hypothetical protein GCM10017608_03020 [Agromyces luteolus]|uniref:Uncharacterized protein n=1 Tax=Agromyces luteolus TaxID=88373 RepID=A0A7C9HFS1_9MICO|nr:hypothetical protein [Agromyces luteolus]MUN05821.1 hypothetical protein [Agromyces luteolus]GLK26370.1 hypothetical protein GCM10017608_03020 [Agromyces luteolus]
MAETPGTQDEPVEEGAGDASRAERIAGILDQVRSDVRLGHAHDEEAELRQRLAEAGITASDEEIERYVAREL